jgi:hypothetical protein
MGAIGRRLRRIEEAARGGSFACPECGQPTNGPGQLVYEEGEERPRHADERCGRCGRPLWFVIRVVYEDKGGGDT